MKLWILLLALTQFSWATTEQLMVNAKCKQELGWMENGCGNLTITISNNANDEVELISNQFGWEGLDQSKPTLLGLTLTSHTNVTLYPIGWLNTHTIKTFDGKTPKIIGNITYKLNGVLCSNSYSAMVPVAVYDEPLITISGKYMGAHLRTSLFAEKPLAKDMMKWMDQCYLEMAELTGTRPYDGDFIVLKDCPPHAYFAYAGNPITLSGSRVQNSLDNFRNGGPCFGWVHELGHDFDGDIGPWVRINHAITEFQANIKVVYALLHMPDRDIIRMKHAGNTYKTADKEKPLKIDHWLSVFARYHGDTYLADSTKTWKEMRSDNYLSFFMRYVDVYGWDCLKQWYRTYYKMNDLNLIPPQTEEGKINLMCAILSEVTGVDQVPAFQLWRLPVTEESVAEIKAQYNQQPRAIPIKKWYVYPEVTAWTNTEAFVECDVKKMTEKTFAAPKTIFQRQIINLKRLFAKDSNYCVAYAATKFVSDKEQTVKFWTGSDDALRVWLNGELVQDVLEFRGCNIDNEVATVTLQKGENIVLAEISQATQGWNFCFRITDENDKPLVLIDNQLVASKKNEPIFKK